MEVDSQVAVEAVPPVAEVVEVRAADKQKGDLIRGHLLLFRIFKSLLVRCQHILRVEELIQLFFAHQFVFEH